MPMLDAESTVKWSFLGLSGAGCLTWLARFLMKSYRTEKLESAINTTDIGGYERLEKEVKRLGRKCDHLERQIRLLTEVEIEGAGDMGMLQVHIANMPCGQCGAPDDTFAHINAIIERMAERRNYKMKLLREPMEEEQ